MSKKKDFLIGGGNRNSLSICLSKFSSVVGVGWLLTYSALAYQFGFDVFYLGIGLIIGFSLLIFWISPKIFDFCKNNNIYNLNSLVLKKTNSHKLKNFFIFFNNLPIFLLLCVLVVGSSNILSINFNISYFLSTLIIVFICFIYLYFGGFKNVIRTDIIQGLVILCFFLFFLFFLIFNPNFSIHTSQKLEYGFLFIFGFFLVGLFATINSATSYQLLFSSKSQKEFKMGFLYFLLPYFFIIIILTLISIFINNLYSDINPELTIIYFFELFSFPIIFILFFYICVLSTYDSYLYALSSHINFFKMDDIKNIKINIFLFSFLVLVMSNIFTNFLNFSILVYGSFLITSIPIIYFIYSFDKKINKSKMFISLILSAVSYFLAIIFIGIKPEVAPIPLFFGVLGLLFKSKKVEKYLR